LIRSGLFAATLVIAAELAAGAGAASAEVAHCPPNRVPPLVLPAVKAAIRKNQEVTIVALGSSSTEGSHATDIAHSYPAVLQSLLNASLPMAHVAVLNRGVGGQDVTEMLPRIDRDVLSVRPTLVIWQVGANGAMKHMQADLFRRLLTNGVQRLRDAKVDVVLMDNQRAPAILASPDHIKFDQAMADVAVATGTPMFDRGSLMDSWRAAGFPYEQFMSDDGVHHNDQGYRCVSEALAQAILDGMGPGTVSSAVANRAPK